MTTLAKTEWLKIKSYNAFWWIMAVTALSYPGMSYIFNKAFQDLSHRTGQSAAVIKAIVGNPFTFPEVWHTLAYSSSLFVFIPSVVVIMFITNEYTYKTHRQNIVDGWSRNQFLTSKMLDVLIVSLIITILYIIISLAIGFSNISDATFDKWSEVYYIGLFALQTFAQLSIAFLVGFLVRKAFISLGVFLFYFLVVENVLVALGKFKNIPAVSYLPLELSDRLIPPPAFWGRFDNADYQQRLTEINWHILYTILFTSLVWFICYKINNKRDL
jgi:ABC-2 type transport system permease protein